MKQLDPDVKHIRAMTQAFLLLSDRGKRPALQWMNDWFEASELKREQAACDHSFIGNNPRCVKCGCRPPAELLAGVKDV